MSDAIDGELRGPARLALLLHLRMCRSCRRVSDNLETVVRTLRSPGLQSIDEAAGSESPAERMVRVGHEHEHDECSP